MHGWNVLAGPPSKASYQRSESTLTGCRPRITVKTYTHENSDPDSSVDYVPIPCILLFPSLTLL